LCVTEALLKGKPELTEITVDCLLQTWTHPAIHVECISLINKCHS